VSPHRKLARRELAEQRRTAFHICTGPDGGDLRSLDGHANSDKHTCHDERASHDDAA
jgi:hypothetical protein